MTRLGLGNNVVHAALGYALIIIAGAIAVSPAAAGEIEFRDFQIFVNKEPAGTFSMKITKLDDNAFSMEGEARVHVRYLVYNYKYHFKTTEHWRDGRLVHMESSTNDDGKRFHVLASAEANGIRVNTNGQDILAKPDAWVSTYWHLPDAAVRQRPLTLIDGDTGKGLSGTLQYIGQSMIKIAGVSMTCNHYRLTGSISAELYYDNQDRLIWLETTEDGRTIIWQLRSVTR
jgi:hypothetical protein